MDLSCAPSLCAVSSSFLFSAELLLESKSPYDFAQTCTRFQEAVSSCLLAFFLLCSLDSLLPDGAGSDLMFHFVTLSFFCVPAKDWKMPNVSLASSTPSSVFRIFAGLCAMPRSLTSLPRFRNTLVNRYRLSRSALIIFLCSSVCFALIALPVHCPGF